MKDLCENVLEASVVASVLGVVVLLLLFLGKSRITPAWRCVLLLMVVVRLLWIYPPSSVTSWENVSTDAKPELLTTISEVVAVDQAEPLELQHSVPSLENEITPVHEEVKALSVELAEPIASVSSKGGVIEQETVSSSYSVAQVITAVWGVGCVALFSVYLWNLIRLKSLIRAATKLTECSEFSLLKEACEIANLRKVPTLVVTDKVQSPAITGVLSPTILLPKNLSAKISDYDLKMILLHELGHHQRRDLWVNQLMLSAQVLQWFNPLAWYFTKRTRVEAERACDAWVLAKVGDQHRSGYGNALLNLIENIGSSKKMVGAVSVVESKSDLKERVKNIATGRLKQSIVSVCVVVTFIVGMTSTAFTKSVVEKKASEVGYDKGGSEVEIITARRKDSTPKTIRERILVMQFGGSGSSYINGRDLGLGWSKELTDKETATRKMLLTELVRSECDQRQPDRANITLFRNPYNTALLSSVYEVLHSYGIYSITVWDEQPEGKPYAINGVDVPLEMLKQAEMKNVSISVVDERGKPIEGVKLTRSVWSRVKYKRDQEYITNSEGKASFKIPYLSQSFRLWVSKFEHVTLFCNFDASALKRCPVPSELTIVMSKGVKVGGYVKDVEGKPVQDVDVEVRANFNQRSLHDMTGMAKAYNPLARSLKTDVNGFWYVSNAPSSGVKGFTLKLSHPNYADDLWGESRHSDESSEDFKYDDFLKLCSETVMEPGVHLSGIVRNIDDEPIANASVIWGVNNYYTGGATGSAD